MKRYILTGTPGCGKTSLIQELEIQGFSVIAEAATDLITLQQKNGIQSPWEMPDFIDRVTEIQKERQLASAQAHAEVEFYDRSPICTYALAQYLGVPTSKILMDEIERMEVQSIYERRVFFIENLGYIQPTAARTIRFDEALKFEQMHKEAYQKFGYDLVNVSVFPIKERAEFILREL